jgi:hypothetical protein
LVVSGRTLQLPSEKPSLKGSHTRWFLSSLVGITGDCSGNTPVKDGHESKKYVIYQLEDRVFADIKSSAALSLGRIEHSNLSGCLQNRTLSFKKQLY